MLRLRDDRGTLSIFVVLLAPAILFLAGLVIDGGGGLVAKQRAADQAEQAARAGANAIDIAVLRDTGDRRIDCAGATAKVSEYFGAYSGSAKPDAGYIVSCGPGSITVHVEVKYKSIFLPQDFTMPADATASPICDTNTLCVVALAHPPATASEIQVRPR